MQSAIVGFIQSQGDYLCLVLGTLVCLASINLLLKRRQERIRIPKTLWCIVAAGLAAGWLAVENAGDDARKQTIAQISALAPTYARELQRMGHAHLDNHASPDDPIYKAMIAAEIQWQALNPHAHDIYTMRKLKDGTNILLVDSESDYDGDGKYDREVESRTPIGAIYDVEDPGLEKAFQGQENFDGEIITDQWGAWVSAFVPMRDADGNVEAVLGVDFDAATWLKTIAAARRGTLAAVAISVLGILCGGMLFYIQRTDLKRRIAAEQRMQLTIRQMPLGFIEWNTDAEVIQWNPAAERIFGYSAGEIVGKAGIPTIVPPSARERVNHLWKELVEAKQGNHSINDNVTKDGSIITCEWFNTPSIGQEGQVEAVFSLLQDVTEKARIEKHLQQSDRLSAVGELAAGVAHDFNNILTVITGHTGLLLGEANLPPHQRFEIKRISEAASRAGGLTRQLLAFSRQQAMFPKPLHLAGVIDGAAGMLSRWLGEDVKLNIHIAKEVPPVEADPAMLEQVITNLVLNARDALIGPGSITISLDSVTITRENIIEDTDAREGPAVCLSVADTGIGIAPDNLPRLFEPFFSTKAPGRGTGLGLSVVHGIVKQHHGWITVDSKPGKGATFKVYLPPTDRPVEVNTDTPQTESDTDLTGAQKTVLLAEDEELVRELARLTLERAGLNVLEAADGLEALRVWREHRDEIDLLFTDMVMPNGMTGRQLAAELLSDRPNLPIIYASGYSLDVIAPEFNVHERVVFLAKPYLTDQLLEATSRCLDPHVAA